MDNARPSGKHARESAARRTGGLRVELDAERGPVARVVGADGSALHAGEPLVSWQALDPASARGGRGHAAPAPPGSPAPVVSASPLERGELGECRLALTITNEAGAAVAGSLVPPFRHPRSPAPEGFALWGGRAYAGTAEGVFAWVPVEFSLDCFSCAPAPTGGGMLTACLVYGGTVTNRIANEAILRLEPGESARYTLHLDLVPGGRGEALAEIYRRRGGYRVNPASYDMSQYRDPRLAWMKDLTITWLNWAWDKENLDPATGEYRLARSLERARELFWGYDAYELWPFWPRAGFDDRFQFEHFRDMPGGIEGLKRALKAAQSLGTRIVVSYCVWSESDRSSSPESLKASYARLVHLACDLEADGVLMDIMSTTPEEIREIARERGRELAPFNEGDPGWAESQTNLVGRIHNVFPMPGFNLKRYLLPHHPILRVCEPGNLGKVLRNDVVLSFFNGHGVEINTMFPEDFPSCREELAIVARAVDLLRTQRDCFSSPEWQPLVPSLDPSVWVNAWPAGAKTVYTLCATSPCGHHGPLLRIPHRDGVHVVDLWRYREIECTRQGAELVASCHLDGYEPGRGVEKGSGDYSPGCIGVFPRLLDARLDLEMLVVETDPGVTEGVLEVWVGGVRPEAEPIRRSVGRRVELDLYRTFGRHANDAVVLRLLDADGRVQDVAVIAESAVRFFRIDKPVRTPAATGGPAPRGMVRVPGGSYEFSVATTQPVWQATWLRQGEVYQTSPPSEPRRITLEPFWMDRHPVTNAEYERFLRASGYRPADPSRFLDHFTGGRCPAGLEDHPVVYVSYEDAKAYCRWAGKRLPTEEEWQYAASGGQPRPWPWGHEPPDASRCPVEAGGTSPVSAHPRGASPYGVEDLVGNVWQWTASLMDNGRHLVLFPRGGSWYRPPEGMWWVKGGPRPVNDHFPLPLFGPGMNRFSTVGFRCVMDG